MVKKNISTVLCLLSLKSEKGLHKYTISILHYAVSKNMKVLKKLHHTQLFLRLDTGEKKQYKKLIFFNNGNRI